MMVSLYNIIIYLSSILIFVGSFFSKKLNLLYEGRKKVKMYFKTINITNEKKIWIHVSSVGEFEQAKSIIYDNPNVDGISLSKKPILIAIESSINN